VARTELTKAQWRAVTGQASDPSLDSYPVLASWDAIRAPGTGFLDLLNAAVPNHGFGLPSEAQWEYACRAGTTTEFFCGGHDIGNYMVYAGTFGPYLVTVASKAPNPWGLFDMSVSLWEWTEDDAHDGYVGAPTDGSAWVDSPTRAPVRIARGGDYTLGDPRHSIGVNLLSSASRSSVVSTGANGFRLRMPVPVAP